MIGLQNGAYPSASRRFIEAVRDYRHKLKLGTQPEVGSPAWYAYMRGDQFSLKSVLHSYFHQPLLHSQLHRTNWRTARPRLYVSIGVDGRDGLYLTARSSEIVESFWGYGFRQRYVTEGGDFKNPFYDLTLVQTPLDNGFWWSFDDGHIQYRMPEPQQFQDERRLCLLAIQSKLHHLSLFFDCHTEVRLIEFGPHCMVDWRRDSQRDTTAADALSSRSWSSPRLKALLRHSGLSAEGLYDFGARYLTTLDEAQRPEALGQYLANSHTGTVTHEDVAGLLALCDASYRAKRWLDDLEKDEGFPAMKRTQYNWLHSFATEAALSEDEALAWILKHHPATYETYTPSAHRVRQILESADAGKLSRIAVSKLDETLARALGERAQWVSGIRARQGLEEVASRKNFENFDQLVDWTRTFAPVAHRAALDLAEVAARVASEARAQANAKRAATKKARASL
jgi:hypothetical protein